LKEHGGAPRGREREREEEKRGTLTSTNMFLVAEGRVATRFSISGVRWTWQPRRELWKNGGRKRREGT